MDFLIVENVVRCCVVRQCTKKYFRFLFWRVYFVTDACGVEVYVIVLFCLVPFVVGAFMKIIQYVVGLIKSGPVFGHQVVTEECSWRRTKLVAIPHEVAIRFAVSVSHYLSVFDRVALDLSRKLWDTVGLAIAFVWETLSGRRVWATVRCSGEKEFFLLRAPFGILSLLSSLATYCA